MPDQPAATGAPGERPPATLWDTIFGVGRTMLMYYFIYTWFFSGKSKTAPPTQQSPDGVNIPQVNQFLPIWRTGAPMNLFVYLSPEPKISNFQKANLVWSEENIIFGNWTDNRQRIIDVPVTKSLANNGSLYAHIYLEYNGADHIPTSYRHNPDLVLHEPKLLTRYMPRRKETKLKKLITKDEAAENDAVVSTESPEWIAYWWPNLTISLVPQDTPLPKAMPPVVLKHLHLAPDGVHYYPFFFANDFWMLEENTNPINNTIKSLQLDITFQHLSTWKHQLYLQMEDSFKIQQSTMGVPTTEMDQIKRMFLETNPILLGITMVVSILHSLFDILAFKNDIQFWRKKKDMEGLSFRSIVLNVITQLIIFLYLFDNDTSWMVLISSGMGVLIEAWKINKAVIVRRKPSFPYVEFEDRVKPSKRVKKTREYDEIAYKYLSYVIVPLLIGYTIYSLFYQEHKSWYSFILNTLVGFVYAFGFITMTPQLFINYKMKSVAHMPWKTFMYKALNTFIDDLFAFVIKMPTLHRLATLRDDVIFLIYLYQRWIYPEDKRRRNEFGQVGEDAGDSDDEEEETDDKKIEKSSETEVDGSTTATTTATATSVTTATQRVTKTTVTKTTTTKVVEVDGDKKE